MPPRQAYEVDHGEQEIAQLLFDVGCILRTHGGAHLPNLFADLFPCAPSIPPIKATALTRSWMRCAPVQRIQGLRKSGQQ